MIFNIQHFSIHDGPGIRTVVFFKGCPLKCRWCANPESQSSNAEIMWLENECLRCKNCHIIENMNFHFEDDRLEWGTNFQQGLDAERAGTPGAKVAGNEKIAIPDSTRRQIEVVCPTKAIQVVGKDWSVERILAEVEKDGLFKTIEQGKFGGVKRPFDGGHGLEGVCVKGENYFNPFIARFMDHE